MKKRRDEAAYLESQADRLEQFVDFSDPRPAVFPKLKPPTARITLRMQSWLLDELKREANRRDVPYQSLLKVVPADWLRNQSAAEWPAAVLATRTSREVFAPLNQSPSTGDTA